MLTEALGFSELGHVYRHNEDAYFIDSVGQHFVLADGMGGHQCGDVASSIAIASYRQALEKNLSLEQRARHCHEAMLNHSVEHSGCAGMGSTLLSAHCVGATVEYTWVGDSRLYWFANGELLRLSRDHSFVQDMIERGVLTEQEAMTHPKRNLINQGLGMPKVLKPGVGRFRPTEAGLLMLCSDGVTDMLDEMRIVQALQPSSLAQKADALREAVLATEARDNFTVILVSVKPNIYQRWCNKRRMARDRDK